MRKLMMAMAVAAMAGGVFADGEAASAAKASDAPARAEASARRAARPAFNREQFMARMKERQAERRAKVAELLKGAGVAEDKVQPLVEEIEKAFSPRSRSSQNPRRGGRAGGAQKAAPAAK